MIFAFFRPFSTSSHAIPPDPVALAQYDLINCLLRRFPEPRFERYRAGGNLFSTTIAVLASAVQKIARVASIPEGTVFFRGLSRRMELPDAFFRPDGKGRRGFAEWGFLSTTCDKSIALAYSFSGDGHTDATAPMPMVIKISSSAVDRGASIGTFSQYPQVPPPFFHHALNGFVAIPSSLVIVAHL